MNKEIYTRIFNEVKEYNHSDIENDPLYTGPLRFIEKNITNINTLIDVGSGRGHFIGLVTRKFPNIKIKSFDLDKFNNLNVDFTPIDLEDNLTPLLDNVGDILSCTGVLEHIHRKYLDNVFYHFHKISPLATFTIANHVDTFFGIDVHVTNEPIEFWVKMVSPYYEILQTEVYYPNKTLFLLNLKSKNK